ncbi:MAG: thiolase family protein [Peptococcaceae bacterium]|jgi:acetyl-CoA C-acetyltransferase|nr:thiolase family protein [Peptococcaceae bacterium]
MLKDCYIIDGARSGFARNGGSLKLIHPTDLGAIVLKEAIKKAGVAPEVVTGTIIGSALSYDTNTVMVHRHVGRKAGLPIETSGMHINTLCGTGYQCVATAAYQIQLGLHEVMGVVGTECMDQVPYHIDPKRLRYGAGAGDIPLVDQLNNPKFNIFTDAMTGLAMPMTTENIVERYGITREECDEIALRSHRLASAAIESGRFAKEIVPIEVPVDRKTTKVFDIDECVRKDVTIEKMAAMKPFTKPDGTVTAANASGINNGAAAVILASGEAVKKYGLKPLAKFAGNKLIGCDPEVMGLGPVPAINGLLKEKGVKLDQVDLIEINEAFAGQVLGCQRELGFELDKFNVNGSGIAIGHPIAATGVRIILSLSYEMKEKNANYGLASICIGGGQGSAVLFEKADI